MNRRVIFSNTALTIKKLEKIKYLVDNNQNIKQMNIYSSRRIKENGIKIDDSNSFKKIEELLNYINDNNINVIDNLEININYKNKNMAKLLYENFDNRWELSFDKQDCEIDSLIFNIKPLMKNNLMKLFRQYRLTISIFVSVIWMIIIKEYVKPHFFLTIVFDVIYLGIIIDMFVMKNVAFRDVKFLRRNKDNFVFYILGALTPYAIEFIIYGVKALFLK